MSQNAEACVVIRKRVYVHISHYYFKVRSYTCTHLSVTRILKTKQGSIFYYPKLAGEKNDTKGPSYLNGSGGGGGEESTS